MPSADYDHLLSHQLSNRRKVFSTLLIVKVLKLVVSLTFNIKNIYVQIKQIWAIFCVLAFRRALSLPENYRVVGGPYTDDPALRRRMEQNMDFIRKPDGMVI